MAPVESLSARSPTPCHRHRVCPPMLLEMWGRQPARGGRPAGMERLSLGDSARGTDSECSHRQGGHRHLRCQLAVPVLSQGLLSPCRLFTERQQLNYRLHSVSCTGTEVHLSMCAFEFYRGNASAACGAGMPAVVSCMPGPLFATGSAHKKKQRQQQQGQVSPAGRGAESCGGPQLAAVQGSVPWAAPKSGCAGPWVTDSWGRRWGQCPVPAHLKCHGQPPLCCTVLCRPVPCHAALPCAAPCHSAPCRTALSAVP